MAHSLGGLFARYAVAMLHTPKDDLTEEMGILGELESRGEEHPVFRRRREPRIAGLEAVNFITLASPHLGVRGKKQVSQYKCFLKHLKHLQVMVLHLPVDDNEGD